MARVVVFTEKDFLPYQEEMFRRGWKLTNKARVLSVLKQLEARSPYAYPIPGMEEGFEKFILGKGLTVFQWSSFQWAPGVEQKGQTRDGWDRGKTGTLESNRIVHYAKERRRIGDFFDRLLLDAYVEEDRASHRPCCKYCGRLMKVMTTEYRQHYWYCEGFYLLKDHPWYTVGWDDIGLSQKSLDFLKDKRERDKRYNIWRIKQGKPKLGFGSRSKKIWTYGT